MDYFKLLGRARRPWIDPEELKQIFLEVSKQFHPDRLQAADLADRQEATGRYAQLNRAYQCLRRPPDRLLHLLELELGARPKLVDRISEGLPELFLRVGELCRKADQFSKASESLSSAIVKVQQLERCHELIGELEQLEQTMRETYEQLQEQLKGMNAVWCATDQLQGEARRRQLPLEELGEIYRAMSFLARWSDQLEDRRVRLSLI